MVGGGDGGWGDGGGRVLKGVERVISVSLVCLLALVAALSVSPSVCHFMYIATTCAFLCPQSVYPSLSLDSLGPRRVQG